MFKILIVCTANICRSPVAEAFLSRKFLGMRVQVESAGTLALGGNSADPTMVNIMTERGFPELMAHRSRPLMGGQLHSSQLILCMDLSHLNYVRRASHIAVGKSLLLGHWDGGKMVKDPVGQSYLDYEESVEKIEKYIQQWASKIIAMELVA